MEVNINQNDQNKPFPESAEKIINREYNKNYNCQNFNNLEKEASTKRDNDKITQIHPNSNSNHFPESKSNSNNSSTNVLNPIIKDNLKEKSIPKKSITKTYNSIPLGSMSNCIVFITFGLFQIRVYVEEDTLLWSSFFVFGAIGQLTSSLLEFFNKRKFPFFFYLINGMFCLFYYILRITIDKYGKYDLCVLFACFSVIMIPIILTSIKINLFFLIQSFFLFLFFFFMCIGEGIKNFVIVEKVSGFFQLMEGITSLYIFLSQALNDFYGFQKFPTFPFDENNGIDLKKKVEKEKEK